MDGACTSVHPRETSGSSPDFPSYRAIRQSYFPDEYPATEELYSHIDKEQGKHRLTQLQNCRQFAWFVRDNETCRVHVHSNACRLRWCPICSQGRSAYITNKVHSWLTTKKFPRFLTLTLKHSNAPLDFQIETLYNHFRTLRKDKQFKGYCNGGVWFFQVKLDNTGEQWHPHIHCLILGKYIPHDWLSKKWLRITKTSNIVDIRAVHNRDKVTNDIARYCARPAMLFKYPLELRVEIFNALHGKKLCGTWGTCKSLSLSPPKTIDITRYQNLGSWSTVHMLVNSDPSAREIIEAWENHETIADGISCRQYDEALEDKVELHITELDDHFTKWFPQFQ